MADIVVTAAVEVAKCVVIPLVRPFCYVFNYSDNIRKLKNQAEFMDSHRQRLKILVQQARSRGDKIFPNVNQWISEAEKKGEEVNRIIGEADGEAKKRCFFGLFPNLKTCHHFGRMACKKKVELDDFVRSVPQEEGGGVSYTPTHPPIPDHEPQYIPSESRSSELKEILEALKDPDVRMIGVYGMPGVGKTMLVHQAMSEVQQSDTKFDAAVIVTVKPDPDLNKIREEIAEKLSLAYKGKDTGEIRKLLWEKLKEKSTVLLILDDLWGSFEYHEVGIPFGKHHQGCKFLLTSRKLEVLQNIGSEKNLQLGVLKDPEDWQLFEKILGSSVKENDQVHSTAKKIVEACAGLPLSIVTMAGTLKHRKHPFQWNNALTELKNLARTTTVPEGIKDVYSKIKLSYQHIENNDLQLFFLLCVTTANVLSTEELLRDAMGWGLLDDIQTMQQARDRVFTWIEDLKDSCLLIGTDDERWCSVHDLVRDVGIFIAREERHMLTVRDAESENRLREGDLERYTSMFLHRIDFSELPEHFNCPQLKFFHLHPELTYPVVPDTFFRDMCSLRVLCLTRMQFSQLPSSIKFLKELRTLCLHLCVLGNISTIGELTKLEILSLYNSEITHLPKELGKLTQLRLLDLRHCDDLELIPVDTISSMRKLEELYILNSFKKWEEDQNASLSELKDLRQLKALEIRVLTAKILPSNFFSMDLQRYKILIGGCLSHWDLEDESKVLKIEYETNDDAIKQFGATKLLEEVEVLFLKNLSGVSSICNGVAREGFSQLKKLRVENSPDVRFIVEAMKKVPTLEILVLENLPKLERICDGQCMEHAFQNLKEIHVDSCPELLERSFPVSSMVKLQTICIKRCSLQYLVKQEEAMANDVGYGDSPMIEFPELCSLKLGEMINFSIQAKQNHESNPSLAFFNKVSFPKLGTLDLARIGCPTLETLVSDAVAVDKKEIGGTESTRECPSYLFGEKVSFPKLATLGLEEIFADRIWVAPLGFESLRELKVKGCNKLRYFFTSSMCRHLLHIKSLDIRDCSTLEEIFLANDSGEDKDIARILSQLEALYLFSLPELKRICNGSSMQFSSLKTLEIRGADKLESFLCASNAIEGKETGGTKSTKETSSSLFNEKDSGTIKCPKFETSISEGVAVGKNKTGGIESRSSFFNEKVSFPKLATLTLGDISNKRIWGAPFEFGNLRELKELEVQGCNNLSYLLTSSMCRDLLHLEKLEIGECLVMEEIFLVDDPGENKGTTIILPQLRCLSLGYLPELKTFSEGSLVQFPSLEALEIGRTKKLEAVEEKEIGGTKSAKEFLITIFNEKVSFPPLKRLSLRNLDDFETIWDDQLDEKLLYKVKELEIEGCRNLKSLFPSNMARSFMALEDIWIRDCDSLTEIFEKWSCGKEEPDVTNLSFNKVKGVVINQCPNLKTVFPASMHKNFKEIRDLEICDCEALEEIIAVDEEGEMEITSYFPAAESVYLDSLPKLRYRVTQCGKIIFPE